MTKYGRRTPNQTTSLRKQILPFKSVTATSYVNKLVDVTLSCLHAMHTVLLYNAFVDATVCAHGAMTHKGVQMVLTLNKSAQCNVHLTLCLP